MSPLALALASVLVALQSSTTSHAFTPLPPVGVLQRQLQFSSTFVSTSSTSSLLLATSASKSSNSNSEEPTLTRVSEEEEGVPIPFIDKQGNSFIECYADSVATVDGVEYTIAVPCDYCVALCYEKDDQLVQVELDDELMDDIFPMAENIVNDEFGEELALQRTPQVLTLVGELEEDDDDEEDDEFDDDDDDDDEYGVEDVELLLAFEHRDQEYNLVRLMDPVLLVGKTDPERPDLRVLLTEEESEKVMPLLESAFLKYHEDGNTMLP